MWRMCRKTIFSRWNVNRQNPVDNKIQNTSQKAVLICSASQKEKYSDQNHENKQHANKHSKTCWDDPQFQFSFLHISILETTGWLGTAAVLCLNAHLKHLKNILEHDGSYSNCIFSRNVLAMPKNSVVKDHSLLNVPDSAQVVFSTINNAEEDKISFEYPAQVVFSTINNVEENKVSNDTDIFECVRNLTEQYAAAVQNSVGLMNLDRYDKKAFRHFQSAARFGSSQAFYNLGLCYELGKGTRVNLNRAAFCYRKAAIKGHGLASFNLAIYFMKGMGGLPVDGKTAKLLLKEAANKGVPEAQMYVGIELLEKGKWLDAAAIFKNLAKENIPSGQYYLGLCYENGWGVEQNEAISAELFTKSAAQGNKKATIKLENAYNKRKNYIKEPVEFPSEKSKVNSLHVSLSVPEFTTSIKLTQISTPSYLDLMIPFLAFKRKFIDDKITFTVGEDKITEDFSSSFLPCSLRSNIPRVMQVKT